MTPIRVQANRVTYTLAELSDPYEIDGQWFLQERRPDRIGTAIWGPESFEVITALRAERFAYYAGMIQHMCAAIPSPKD